MFYKQTHVFLNIDPSRSVVSITSTRDPSKEVELTLVTEISVSQFVPC